MEVATVWSFKISMSRFTKQFFKQRMFMTTLLAAACILSGCTKMPEFHSSGEPFDPYEETNRKIHEFNIDLDHNIVRPAGLGVTKAIPDDIEDGLGNFVFNLSLPSAAVNNLMQANIKGAWHDTARFAVNSTVGLLGVFDVASDMGMTEATKTNLSETLYVWGVQDGAYTKLPFLGPSTGRDTVGTIGSLFTNPMNYLLNTPQSYASILATLLNRLSVRGRNAEFVDSVLYESADSYTQTRSIYLQNRQFRYARDDAVSYLYDYEDPYQ